MAAAGGTAGAQLSVTGGVFTEHLANGLLRGDTAVRLNTYRTAILAGWMSRNEARSLENLNPEDGLDTFLEPLNTGPVDGDESGT